MFKIDLLETKEIDDLCVAFRLYQVEDFLVFSLTVDSE
jgi:hypothetical protein